MQSSRGGAAGPAPFCHVVRREKGRKKFYVVHTQSPRFVVEMESASAQDGDGGKGVIRRVSLPNSWAGDYHHSGRRLGDAIDFFEATSHLRSEGES